LIGIKGQQLPPGNFAAHFDIVISLVVAGVVIHMDAATVEFIN
jgi:hypothetical protein